MREQASHRRRIQVVAGGVTGVAGIMIMVGIVIARLATTSNYSAEAVVMGVTIAGALIGGFLVAPYLDRIAVGVAVRSQNKDLSSSRLCFSSRDDFQGGILLIRLFNPYPPSAVTRP
jgi:divalent metal cation (Fe/Co/Zn/Cd) transporter